MNVKSSVVDAIGNTPLIRLRRASELTGCEIFGKAEFMNPGQSVKDRAALYIVRDAVARGRAPAGRRHRRGHRRQHRHRPRAGRRRAGLPHGHRHPRHPEPGEEGHAAPRRRRAGRGARRALQRPEQLREGLGPPRRRARARASRTARSGRTSSTTSPTASAHYETTGPEIWEQTDGKVDAFICAVGTGGTLAGVGMALQGAQPDDRRSASPTRWARRSSPTTPPAS